jgi:hypothetical protein
MALSFRVPASDTAMTWRRWLVKNPHRVRLPPCTCPKEPCRHRPQVPSQGHHDPLDGYLTFVHLGTMLPATERRDLDECIRCAHLLPSPGKEKKRIACILNTYVQCLR